jgi:RNA polymerase sigma factor (sigma-70 family)
MDFEKLTYSIKDKLYRFSLRITGNVMEAEDVVQEVFFKIWEKRDQMTDIQNPEAWCMTLTKNLSLDKLRSKHRNTTEISEAVYLTDSNTTPYQSSEKADLMDKIKDLMAVLPEKQKMVMHLRDIEGMTYDEIAVQLNMPLPQVKVYLHRARSFIREKMLETEQYGI